MKVEEEFDKYDKTGAWLPVYQKIRQDSALQHDFSLKDAKRPEFKGRNRYRDVSPYDHSRVCLETSDIDYINASLVEYEAAHRSYILTQGPLPHTAGHLWLMIWEQNTRGVLMLNRLMENGRGPLPGTAGHFWLMVWEYSSQAVLMLNRIIEKGMVKCHQYFPMGLVNEDEDEMVFEDVSLKVSYISEENFNSFVVRTLEIENMETGEKKQVLQFHYTTWPDFGVPESPEAFLSFLFAVRQAGVLEQAVGPPVIHCSAGIGRSGTFCLVDTCLILLEKTQDPNSVSVCDVLMEMREYRMGLIQTADQLRFSYMAIIEGYKQLLTRSIDSGIDDNQLCQSSSSGSSSLPTDPSDDLSDLPSTPPPIPTRNPRPPSPKNPPPSSEPTPPPSPTPNSTLSDNNNPSKAHDLLNSYSLGSDTNGPTSPYRRTNPTTTESSDSRVSPNHTINGSAESTNQETENDFIDMSRQTSVEIRRRNREDRKKNTAAQLALMKKKQRECEKYKLRQSKLRPYFWGISVAVLIGSYLVYKYLM